MSRAANGYHSGQLYIDGSFREAEDSARYDLPNPATEEIVGSAPDGRLRDMEDAVAAARRAFDEGPWSRSDVRERAEILERIADGLEQRKEELRSLLVAAHGAETPTHWMQLDAPIELLRNYAELARVHPFEEKMPAVEQATPGGSREVETLLLRQPVGVCALIPTWNFPLWVTCQKLGPALAAGCTMVVKPSPWGPLIDLVIAELIEAAGVPPGVFNLLTSRSLEVSEALVEHPAIDMVSFTGSNATGQAIARSASTHMTRCHLELGGKSALLVLDDFDLDAAAAAASAPVAVHAGQGCALMTRVLVQERNHDALVEKMQRYIETQIQVGDPADPDVVLGPVIRPERRDQIEAYIESGVREGADLVTGGGRPADLKRGWFVEPTLFGGVRNDMRIAREEIFGPVISVIPFRDEDDAVRLANDSNYGLFGGVLTEDKARAVALSRRIRAGGISINGAVNSFQKPSGGFKHSGLGRENGRFGIEEFTELQAVMWPEPLK
ncbi:MAG: aldehyde dehydrogenase family protein [Myxococcota bacterium]|nr:aldehyde dehydrogenase family protein [Myxococcota bacterium]